MEHQTISRRKASFLEAMYPYGFDQAHMALAYDDMIRLRTNYYPLVQTREFIDDTMIYDLKIARIEKQLPYLQRFEATLRRVPAIAHAIFNGIDSSSLEKQLLNISRKAVTRPAYVHSGKFRDDIIAAWKQMEQFGRSGEQRAVDILQQLQVKHWQGTIAERFVHLDLKTTRYDRSFAFNTAGAYKGITAEQAYNLLCGRAVRRAAGAGCSGEDAHWLVLDRPEVPDAHSSLIACRFRDFDPEEILREVAPIAALDQTTMDHLISRINNGDRVQIADGAKQYHIDICFNAEHRRIDILNTSAPTGATVKTIAQQRPKAGIRKRRGRSL